MVGFVYTQLKKSRDFSSVTCKDVAMERYISKIIEEFSTKKMVFLAGPRQIGKTTVAKRWLELHGGLYLNWDSAADRTRILKQSFLESPKPALILDEIHKYPRWRNYLKGLYDKDGARFRLLVTGSARLDYYRRGGDSLFGRYELLRLHPISIGEVSHGTLSPPPSDWLIPGEIQVNLGAWDRLQNFGGFPEPYFTADHRQHSRWSLRRRELLIKEDLRDVSDIKLVELVEHLYLLLPERVGGPLSINSLKEELQVAFNSVASWIEILERLYICFRISPFHRKLARSLKKERKLYLWDWSQVKEHGARFENIVASHLLKSTHAWTDMGFGEYQLHYWRNKEKEEVDFIITKDREPIVAIECKYSDPSPSPSLLKLSSVLRIPAIQLVADSGVDRFGQNFRVVSAPKFLANLV
jgi:predicted AAA+ superfamily ATPase